MHDAVQELRTRAELLHHLVKINDEQALRRIRKSAGILNPAEIRRRHCLAVLAVELGFANWLHAKSVLSGASVSDYGTLLYPKRCGGHLNLWFRTHVEASTVRQSRQGYLLAYRRSFVVVDRFFIESLGLEPDDSGWESLHFDWTHDGLGCVEVRARMYATLVAMLVLESKKGVI